jgi:catalase
VVWNEAVKINGADPDFHRRDLWNAIQAGDPPEWELGVQLFDDAFADRFGFDVLDATKLIPEEDVPVRIVGRMVLDQTVDNFFAETEQVAFCTQNVPPGIGFTNDPLLQGRNFSYLDTQISRLGSPNFTHLPVNAPRCPFGNFQQDGHMAMRNPAGRANFEPNSLGAEGGPRESPQRGYQHFAEAPDADTRPVRAESFADHYSQARQFYVSQTPVERKHIGDALTFELSKVERPEVRTRVVSHLVNIDEMLAKTVARGLGLPRTPAAAKPAKAPQLDLAPSDALSILKQPPRLKGRKVGVLATDGADADLFQALSKALTAEGVTVEVVAPHIAGPKLSDGEQVPAMQKIDGGPSVLYDAVVLLLSDAGAKLLADDKPTLDFVSDAFAHCKVIGHTAAARALLDKAGVVPDDGIVALGGATDAKAFVKAAAKGRRWERELATDADAEPSTTR